ncbi:MAG: hypothetical protein ACRDQ1_15605, partial [Sciscionella sp.]
LARRAGDVPGGCDFGVLSMTRNRLRLQIGVLGAIALALVALLVLSGSHGRTIREAAYDLGGIDPVVRLTDGGRACEAPVEADGAFRQLVFWSNGAGSKALVSVHQGRTPNTPTLALGILESGAEPGENVAKLTQAVTPSPDMSVCVKSVRGAVTLWGGQSEYLSNFSGPTYGAPVVLGFQPKSMLWMQAWSTRPHGIWDSLSLAFRRMSLFRLNWIGAWTFWILLVGVFTGFPLLVLAIWLALKAEQGHDDDISPRYPLSPRHGFANITGNRRR